MNKLIVFPGLWNENSLQLGNIRNTMALHCDEELIRYLDHVYAVWNHITLGNPEVSKAVDSLTVQNLERMAPLASSEDRTSIREGIVTGKYFEHKGRQAPELHHECYLNPKGDNSLHTLLP